MTAIRLLIAAFLLVGWWQTALAVLYGQWRFAQTIRPPLQRLQALAMYAYPFPIALYGVKPSLFAKFSFATTLSTTAAGELIFAAGILLWIWSQRSLGPNWNTGIALRENHELVVRGPYRKVRHPMYAAFILMAFGLFFATSNWLVPLPLSLHVALTVLLRMPLEEKLLATKFGVAYREYEKRTASLFPSLLGA